MPKVHPLEFRRRAVELQAMTIPTLVVTAVGVGAIIVVAEPITALVTFVYLEFVGWLMNSVLSHRAIEAGRVTRDFGSHRS